MDIFITNGSTQPNGGLIPQRKFFEPIIPKGENDGPSGTETLTFHLIVFDPASDSSLTPGWTVPVDPLVVPEAISISGLTSLLRDHLPVRRHRLGLSAVTARAIHSGSSTEARTIPSSSSNHASTSEGGGLRASPSGALFGKLRRPKLEYAHVFIAHSLGEVVPICRNDADWYFKDVFVRVDLTNKTEMEWRLFKELVVAAGGHFKCYLAVKGQGSRSPFHW
jgi:hypothetical protein